MPGGIRKEPFLWRQGTESAKQQASRVFNALKAKIKADPTLKIGLIYSANNKQAEELHAQMRIPGTPIPVISGENQAEFYGELIKLINADTELPKDSIHILPIATSLNGGNDVAGNTVDKEKLDRDLSQITTHISQGYQVLGIQGKESRYAIGGGVSENFYNKETASIDGQSLGDYVQAQLKTLEHDHPGEHLELLTTKTPTFTDVYSKLDKGLKEIVDEYQKVRHANGENKLPSIDNLEDKHVIVFHFDDAESAENFFKGQAAKHKPFDMTFKGQDRRMYSDGSGQMVIGTKQEVDDYIVKKDNFTVDEHGHLSRKAVTAGSDTPASSAIPPGLTTGDDSNTVNSSHIPGLGSGAE